jgi:hypothetical protein
MLGFSALGEHALGEGERVSGYHLNKTQADNTLTASASVSSVASAAIAQAGNTLSTAVAVKVTAELGAAQADNTLGTVVSAIAGLSLARTQDDNAIAADGITIIGLNAAVTQDDNVLTAVATKNSMRLSRTQADNTLVATISSNAARVAVVQQDNYLEAFGTVPVGLSLTATQDDDILAASLRFPMVQRTLAGSLDDTLDAGSLTRRNLFATII